jgi:hypothetical protein
MSNMSRIRNTLRFQTPEERVLNALLALVVIVLVTVAIAKVRDDRVEAAPEVKGATLSRARAEEATTARPGPRDTATTIAPSTTTLSPADLYAFAVAVQDQARRGQRPATTTTTQARPTSAGATAAPPATAPATTPSTRPPTTSSTTTSSTTTTTTTTTTTSSTTTTTTRPARPGTALSP